MSEPTAMDRLTQIAEILYLDLGENCEEYEGNDEWVCNFNKEWDVDMLDRIADVIRPVAKTILGLDTVGEENS